VDVRVDGGEQLLKDSIDQPTKQQQSTINHHHPSHHRGDSFFFVRRSSPLFCVFAIVTRECRLRSRINRHVVLSLFYKKEHIRLQM